MIAATLLEEARRKDAELSWEGTFAEYLTLVTANPALARLSAARIYDMIVQAGVTRPMAGRSSYALFAEEVFGQDRALEQLLEHLRAASRRLEVRKRVLVLLGPPGSGKSTIATALKRGLERYSRTPEGAIYAIAGCPMQEEPLHLIPAQLRPHFREQYGLYIEGDLCPRCRYLLRHEYGGKVEDVRIKRIFLDEQEGVGFGTLVASVPASLEVSRLVGSVDESALTADRVESAGRAYRLDGELNAANRGMMEFVDIFKLDERLLSVLEVLAEEQKIKAGRFGVIYADEVVLAHTNEADYQAFVSNPRTEALQDRFIIIRVPYNLSLSAEVRIYQKLLRSMVLNGVHLAPLALPTAAAFAILSRLQPSKRTGVTPAVKLKLYDGQCVPGFPLELAADLRVESPRDGMEGVSPRFVMNVISDLLGSMEKGCLTPTTLLTKLWSALEQNSRLSREERAKLAVLFHQARLLYEEMAQRDLRRAAVASFELAAADHLRRYLENAERSLLGQSSDEAFLRGCEDAVGIRERERASFRARVRQHFAALAEAGIPDHYSSEPHLKVAIEQRLLPEWRQLARVFASRGPEAERQREAIIERLVGECGYEHECAVALCSDGERMAGDSKLPRWPWS